MRRPRYDASVTFVQAGLRPPADLDRFDVVVVDSITTWRLAPWVTRSRPPGVSLVGMAHQPPGGIDSGAVRRAAQRPLDRFVYERCDVVVAASHTLAGELIGEHGLDPGRVRVVEPGCDLPGLPPAPDMRRGRRIAVLCVANWLPNKGIHELLDAVRALPNDAVTVHFAGREDVDHRYTRRIRRQLARRPARPARRRPWTGRPLDGCSPLRRRGRVRVADPRRDVRHGRRRGAPGRSAGGRLAHGKPAEPDLRWCRRSAAAGGRRRRAVDHDRPARRRRGLAVAARVGRSPAR